MYPSLKGSNAQSRAPKYLTLSLSTGKSHIIIIGLPPANGSLMRFKVPGPIKPKKKIQDQLELQCSFLRRQVNDLFASPRKLTEIDTGIS